ncbi:MAG: hypothetical protein PHS76_03410 [Sphaerochaeta sp.]|nr:hypothetical protein [Sphaerochaeta sp.]
MRMKFIALLAALVLLPAVLFAVPVVVTWEWLLEDPMVTTFRYQVDGEDDDKWTVVDSSVTSYTERGLDGTLAHTLYLQQSYDGVHFSGSAISVAEPMFPAIEEMPVLAEEPAIVAEPEVLAPVAEEIPVVVAEEEIAPVAETEAVVPVAEEVVVAEEVAPVAEEVIAAEEVVPVAEEVIAAEEVVAAEEPVMVAEEVAAPVETAPVEPVVATQPEPVVAPVEPVELPKAKAESRYYTTISLGGTANFLNTTIGGYNDINLQAGVGIQLNNLMTFNKTLGLGVDMELMYSPYNKGGWGDLLKFQFSNIINNLNHAATISIAPMLNMEFGKVAFDLGVGGFFTYGPSLATTDGDSMLYGAFAKAALEYKFNKSFSLGASGKYGFILSEGSLSSAPQFAEGSVYMGFSF